MILLWLWALVLAQAAAPLQERFDAANDAYEQYDFLTACSGYEALVSQGGASGPVLYNLGNSYLQLGNLGRAVTAYREAQMYWPREARLNDNLNFARNSSKAMVAPVERHPLSRWLLFWHHRLTLAESRWFFAGLNLFFWFSALLWVVRPKWAISRSSLLLTSVPLAVVGFSLVIRTLVPMQVGVILSDATRGYDKPTLQSSVDFVIREGTEVWWSQLKEGWVFVRLSDGRGGWIDANDLALLRL